MKTCSVISTYARVTDRQTDRQTGRLTGRHTDIIERSVVRQKAVKLVMFDAGS